MFGSVPYSGTQGAGKTVSSIFGANGMPPSQASAPRGNSPLRSLSRSGAASGMAVPSAVPQQPQRASVTAPGQYPNFSASPPRAMEPSPAATPSGAPAEQQSDQVTHLLGVVEQSQQYGRQIEQSVEELAHLLHKKTVECEGLRAIAQQKDSGLRQAVRNEYEFRIKSESRQLQETRNLQAKIDTLQVEKVQLQQEVESLRGVVSQLQSVPPPTNYRPDDHSLFNRILRGPNVVDDDIDDLGRRSTTSGALSNTNNGVDHSLSLDPSIAQHAKDEVYASWNLPRANAVTPQQRNLIHYVANMNQDEARALQSNGVFDFLRVMAARMCKADADGTYPDLPSVCGELIRERKIGDGPSNLAAEAALPMQTVVRNDRQKVTDLFLANNPSKFNELGKLLEEWRGREGELYHQLKREYESNDPSASGLLQTKIPLSNASEANTPVELHARVILMYKKYNPQKLNSAELNDLFAKYPPEVLLSSLVAKYGPEPTAAERRDLVRLLCD